MNSIATTVVAVVTRHCQAKGSAPVTLATPLETLAIDSLSMFEVVFDLEEAFGIELPDDGQLAARFAQFRTPADIVAMIDPLVAQKAA
jgi:acyl carrier protein